MRINFSEVSLSINENQQSLVGNDDVMNLLSFLTHSFAGSTFGGYQVDIARNALEALLLGDRLEDESKKHLVAVLMYLTRMFKGCVMNGVDPGKASRVVLNRLGLSDI